MSPYLFIHIPKTGGRSVLSALGDKFTVQHRTIVDVQDTDRTLLGPTVTKFTVIRNPWDRAVSMWMFFGHMGLLKTAISFRDWLARKKNFPDLRPRLSQWSHLIKRDGTCPINNFLRFENLAADFASIASTIGIAAALPHIGEREKSMVVRIANIRYSNSSEVDTMRAAVADYHNAYTTQALIDTVSASESEVISRFGYSYP